MTLSEYQKTAREELRGWAKDNPENTEPHDAIHEIADGSVPVYNHDILALAADDCGLATTEPELGPAFDGTPTPINIIAANIFEAIYDNLWEEWRGIESDRKDAEVEETA